MVTVKLLFMEGKGERGEELFLELVTSDCLFLFCQLCLSADCVCVFMCAYIYTYIDGFPPSSIEI